MQGLELSEKYYNFCKNLIKSKFPAVFNRCAFGLVGEGSECFGFDDNFSTDHDFEPAFCIWLSKTDYKNFGFELEKEYKKLPNKFCGYYRQPLNAVGGQRHGVFEIGEFYNKFLGTPQLPNSLEQWLFTPSEYFATASNGKVFFDGLGEFSQIRNGLKNGYPQDVKLKKIAANLVFMQQTGLYNYNRQVKRGELGAAQLCVFEFVKHTLNIIYLINNSYKPFYKWVYKGMRNFSRLCELEGSLTALCELPNGEVEFSAKLYSIEQICKAVVTELEKDGLLKYNGLNLENYAVTVQNKITNSNLRNMHIMDGI